MEMVIIVSLVFIAMLLLVAEILLLPGFFVAGILSVISFVSAFCLSYEYYNTLGFIITLSISFTLSSLLIYLAINKNRLHGRVKKIFSDMKNYYKK